MDFRDHDYAINQHDSPNPAEYTYKSKNKQYEGSVSKFNWTTISLAPVK